MKTMHILHRILLIVLSVAGCFLMPIGITVISLFYLFRMIVLWCQHFIKPELGRIVSPLSNLFGVDNIYSMPTATIILGTFYKGSLSKEFVTQLISAHWLSKVGENGKILYPELQQSLFAWSGFTFWRYEENFSVNDHIKFLSTNEPDVAGWQLPELFVHIVNEPFKLNQSPWEIIICPNIQRDADAGVFTKSTLVLFKAHHSLVDGFAMLNLGENNLWNNPQPKNTLYSESKYTFISKCLAIIRIPYFLAKSGANLLSPKNISTRQIPAENSNRQVAYFTRRKFNLLLLKRLKLEHGVTLTSVLLAGYTAAIRKILEKNYIELSTCSSVSCILPVLMAGHPNKLRNYMSFVTLSLPVGESCSRKRLMKIHQNLNTATKSLDTLSLFYCLNAVGRLPNYVVKIFMQKNPSTFLFSNFPGLTAPISIDEYDLTDVFFNGGLLQGNLDVIGGCVGYSNSVEITLTFGRKLVNSQTLVEEIADTMSSEFDSLQLQNFP